MVLHRMSLELYYADIFFDITVPTRSVSAKEYFSWGCSMTLW